jgi:hypothetical protein
MRLNVQSILLIGAVVLFVLAALVKDNQFDLLAIGLALLAAAQLVAHVGPRGFGRGRFRT